MLLAGCNLYSGPRASNMTRDCSILRLKSHDMVIDSPTTHISALFQNDANMLLPDTQFDYRCK